MSSSPAIEPDAPDLVCQLENVQGMVDALTCVRWKRHQDALVELSEHGIVLIVEESGCLQAKVYLQRELFTKYEYGAQGRPRFGISLGLLVDCLNTFSSPGHSNTIEIKYPGPDMELLLKGEGHGDLQIDFMYYANTDLLLAFHCDTEVSYGYKYKFLKATTANIPGNVVRENRGSKLTIGRGGMLKVQHLVSVGKALAPQVESAGYQPPSRIAYIEFYVKPEEPAD